MVKHFLFISLLVLNLFAVNTDEVSVFDMMDKAREDKFVNSPTSNPKTQKPPKEQDFSRKFVSPQPERITPEQMRNIVPTNEPDISVPDNQVYDKIKVKELLLKATNVPKNVVIGEIFSVEIVADTQNDFEFEFETQLDETNIKWLNKKNFQWVKSEDNKYVGTFYLEATSIEAKTLKVSLTLKRNGENYQSSSINIFLPKLKELRSDFNIENKTILKQGVDTINGDFNSQSAYYFAVFKPNKKSLDFNYYNLKKAKFESFSLPVSVEDDDVSTQIGLNPKQSEFSTYKDVIIYSCAVIFILLAIWRRRLSYFFVAAIFIALGIYTYNPFGKAVLRPDISVSILPTKNSTIFYTSRKNENVEILDTKGDYSKILFADGKIGWVKKDNLVKN